MKNTTDCIPDWWSFRHSKDADSFPTFLLPWVSFRPRRRVSLSPTNGESAHLSFGIGRHYWTLAWGWTNIEAQTRRE